MKPKRIGGSVTCDTGHRRIQRRIATPLHVVCGGNHEGAAKVRPVTRIVEGERPAATAGAEREIDDIKALVGPP
jgi:hypothetical protein